MMASLQHPMRTRDPEKAKLFVVPSLLNEVITQHLCLEGSCDLDLQNETENTSAGSAWHTSKSYLGPKGVCHRGVCDLDLLKLTDKVLGDSPWFKRYGGSDHLIVASHSASGWFARFDNIVRCNIVAHESRNWNLPIRAAMPKLTVGSPCTMTQKLFDFAMVASMKGKETHKARRDICNWVSQNRSVYSMPVCGEGQQCPALAQSRFGFHVRGDTLGSNRLVDTLLSGTVPIFTQKGQYEILPDWIDWERLSYFADVSDREMFLAKLDEIHTDRESYKQKLNAVLANRDLFDWRTLTPFDTFMYMLLCHIRPELRRNVTSPYSALILDRPGGFRVFGKRSVTCDANQNKADNCRMCLRSHGKEGCSRDCHWCQLGAAGVGMAAQNMPNVLSEADKCVHITQKCRAQKMATSEETTTASFHPLSQLVENDVYKEQQTALEAVESIRHPVYPKSLQPNTMDVSKVKLTPNMRSKRVIYFVTPTYMRPSQMVDLIRLKQTLVLASLKKHHNIYWIVVEDSLSCTKRVRKLLDSSGLQFAHVAVPTSTENSKVVVENGVEVKIHRGTAQRHKGLDIVKEVGAEGVVYFGDDDNAYDTQLFAELPFTRKVSVFGVGFVGKALYSRCQVSNETGLVVDIHSGWRGPKGLPERKYPMDMAGFAFSTNVLMGKSPRFNMDLPSGYLESGFLDGVVSAMAELEPLAGNCTKILAWHVKTSIRPASKQITTESEQDLQRISSLI